MQTPWWTIDYACHPQAGQSLHPQLLAWADHRARQALDSPSGRPCWFVNAFSWQRDRIHDLEKTGFACQAHVGQDSWSKVLLQHSANTPLADDALPVGFSVRPLAGKEEVEAYVRLHRSVFETDTMKVAWRARILCCPEYQAELDLVAVAPDGRLAAFCICWLATDAEGRVIGQIEPLGVHRDFCGMGLGRAILVEGLRRLYRCGADRVYVETDQYRNAALGLYEAVGFRAAQEVLVYRKDYLDAIEGSRQAKIGQVGSPGITHPADAGSPGFGYHRLLGRSR
jgi:ribosomal protein S18 acetylase RimI-like enzyme